MISERRVRFLHSFRRQRYPLLVALCGLLAGCTTLKTQAPDAEERAAIASGARIPVVLRLRCENGLPDNKHFSFFAIARCESHERLQIVPVLPSANEELRREGWVYLLLEPGTYQLYASMENGGYISEDDRNFTNPYHPTDLYGLFYIRWLRLEVPPTAKAVYAGDLTWRYRLLKDAIGPGNRRWRFEGCATGYDEAGASRAVAAITGAPLPVTCFRTQLWSESNRSAAWTEVGRIEADELEMTFKGVNWQSRGMSLWTGISTQSHRMRPAKTTDNAPAAGPADAFLTGVGSFGEGGAALVFLYALYLPVGTLAGAGSGMHDQTVIDPQLRRLGAGLVLKQPNRMLATALNAARQTGLTTDASGPERGLLCRVAVLKTTLVECGHGGRFCLELLARVRWLRQDNGELVGERFYCVTNQQAWEPTGIFPDTSGRPYETAVFGQPTHAKEELGKDEIQQQVDLEFGQGIERLAAAIVEGK